MLLVLLLFSGCNKNQLIHVASFNLLSSQFKFDFNLGPYTNDFELKRVLQANYIDSVHPDLLFLQEAEPLFGQVDFLVEKMPHFKDVKASNGLALLYDTTKLKIIKHGFVDSLSLQYASFQTKGSEKIFHTMNVHLGGGEGSLLSLRKNVAWASKQWNLNTKSTILAGDMNIGLAQKYYNRFVNEFSAFSDPNFSKVNAEEEKLLDWILLNKGFEVINSGWEHKKFNSRFVSDHPMVWASLRLKEAKDKFDYHRLDNFYSKYSDTKSKVNKLPVSQKVYNFSGDNYFQASCKDYVWSEKQYTVSFWVKAGKENNQLGQNYLLSNQGYPYGWQIEIRSGVLYFEARLESKPNRKSKGVKIVGTTKVFPERWYHVVLTIDAGNEAKLFLDGDLQGTTPLNGRISYHAENPGFFLGTRWDLRNIFRGQITYPEIFKSIISDEEPTRFNKNKNGNWDKVPMIKLDFEEHE